jgi:hypothetical protein
VLTDLNRYAEAFKAARVAFLAAYDDELARWKAQHPGFERLIEAELLPQAVVASRFVFGYEVFAINAVDGDAELALLLQQGEAGNLTGGLVGALYADVARESCAFVRDSLSGRDQVTQKFLRPMRALREKLAGLAFLDPGIAPLVGSIDEVLAAVPPRGTIDGASLAALRGVVMLLTDPTRMREHGRLLGAANAQELSAAAGAVAVSQRESDGLKAVVPPSLKRAQRVSAFW